MKKQKNKKTTIKDIFSQRHRGHRVRLFSVALLSLCGSVRKWFCLSSIEHLRLRVLTSMVFLASITGCQLALEDTGAAADSGRLIGVYVTTEHLDLFDTEAYLNDNISVFSGGTVTVKGDSEKYQGRVYAELITRTLTSEETGAAYETQDYVFDTLDGIAYYAPTFPDTAERERYVGFSSDGAISGAKSHLTSGDSVDSIELEATVYVSPTPGSGTYFMNPVYQSGDGRVYLMGGSGVRLDGSQSEGSAFTETLTDSRTITENGKAKTESATVKLTISTMYPPERIVVSQFDGNHGLLSLAEYAPGEMPEELAAEPAAAYMVVEAWKRDIEGSAVVDRKLYNSGEEYIETFAAREDGVCESYSTRVVWAAQTNSADSSR
jgi:hypothetical protein